MMFSRSALSGFLVGSAVSTLALLLYKHYDDKKKKKKSSLSLVNNNNNSNQQQSKKKIPLALRQEQLSRHELYFGSTGMECLKRSKILVVGLGGVGSHAACMLARSGVGSMTLIDFDQVSLSSLNRHACATLSDVGIPKVTCVKNFCTAICPDAEYLQVTEVVQMYTADNGPTLLNAAMNYDLVIDAIDDVPTKAALIAQCHAQKIPVISCMGAGGKSDVTRLHISDLKTASRDPLASKLRMTLKQQLQKEDRLKNSTDKKDTNPSVISLLEDMSQLSVLWSSEKTVVKLADFTDEQKKEGVHQFGAVDGMRIRIIPVLGTMPAIMGQALAASALCKIGQKPFSPVTSERVGRNVRNKLHQHLKRREKKLQDELMAGKETQAQEPASTTGDNQVGTMINGTWVGPVQIDTDDVEYLLEVWRNRCAVTGDRLGVVLELARWDVSKPSTCQNLVILSAKALHAFDASPGDGRDSVADPIRSVIEERLALCRIDSYGY